MIRRTAHLLIVAVLFGAAACSDATAPASPDVPAVTMTPLTTASAFDPGTIVRFRGAGFTPPADSLQARLGTTTTWLYRDAATTNEFVFLVPPIAPGAHTLAFPSLGGGVQWTFTVATYTPIANATSDVTALVSELQDGMDSLLVDDGSASSLALRDRLAAIDASLAALSPSEAALVAYLVRSNRPSSAGAASMASRTASLLAAITYANCSAGLADLALRENRLVLLALQAGIGVGLVSLPTGITQIAGGLLLVEAIVSNRELIKETPGIIAGAFDACWTRRTLWEIVEAQAAASHAVPAALDPVAATLRANNTDVPVFLNDIPRSFELRGQYGLSTEAATRLSALESLIVQLREILPTAWVNAIDAATDVGSSRVRAEPSAGITIQGISSPSVVGSVETGSGAFTLRFRFADGAPRTPVQFTYRVVDAARGLDVQRSARLESADAEFVNLGYMAGWVARDLTAETSRFVLFINHQVLEPGVRYRVRGGYRAITLGEYSALTSNLGGNQQLRNQAFFNYASAGGGGVRTFDSTVLPASDDFLATPHVAIVDETGSFTALAPGSPTDGIYYLMFVEIEILDTNGRVVRFYRGASEGYRPSNGGLNNAWPGSGISFGSTQ